MNDNMQEIKKTEKVLDQERDKVREEMTEVEKEEREL